MAAPNNEGTSNPVSLGNSNSGTLLFAAFTPVTAANGGTVTLDSTQSLNVIRTTADGTIAGAIINLPANPPNGIVVRIVSTGTVTAVTGTLAGATVVPAITTLAAGVAKQIAYNSTLKLWFQV